MEWFMIVMGFMAMMMTSLGLTLISYKRVRIELKTREVEVKFPHP